MKEPLEFLVSQEPLGSVAIPRYVWTSELSTMMASVFVVLWFWMSGARVRFNIAWLSNDDTSVGFPPSLSAVSDLSSFN